MDKLSLDKQKRMNQIDVISSGWKFSASCARLNAYAFSFRETAWLRMLAT